MQLCGSLSILWHYLSLGTMARNKKPYDIQEHLRILATADFIEEAIFGLDLKQG